jgi:transmembrane sensor
MAAIAGLLVLLTGDASWLLSRSQVVSAPPSKVRLVQLQDGSTVYLRGGTQIDVRYSRLSRSVDLLRGQALFRVVHDTAWPFRVQSGTAEVVDVGTQFDVDRGSGQTIVTVLEGNVDVLERRPEATAHAGASAQRPTLSLRLSAGEQVRLGPAVMTPQVKMIDIRPVAAWTHRYISFDNRPLGEVIAQINSYTLIPIVIVDPLLRKLRVNGMFDVYDTESLLLFLKEHGEIDRTPDAIYVHGRPPAPVPMNSLIH